MRHVLKFIAVLFSTGVASAQDVLGKLLVSGIEDTRTFTEDYISPAIDGVTHSRTGGWYQTAKVKKPMGFEISVIGNAATNLENSQSFVLDTREYENLQFPDGETSKEVASILGRNEPPVDVLLSAESSGGNQQILFRLPQGLGSSGVEWIPTAFVQARLGLFKGTEIKGRYFPVSGFDDVEVQLYGGAIQHEFTSWLPAPDLFPVAVSGLVAYSVMDGSYDFTGKQVLEGRNQRLESDMDYWLFSAIVSTNFRVVNFYGGIGYVDGTAKTDMLGTFDVIDENSGNTIVSEKDPFSISRRVTGIKGNAGIAFQLGLFKINAEYNFQEYDVISAGVHIGI